MDIVSSKTHFTMKKILLFNLIFFVLILQACKTTYVSYSKSGIPVYDALSWNERIKVKTTDIYLRNGTVLTDKITRIRSNEIIYVEGKEDLNDYRSLALEQVKEVHIKPQLSSSFYVGLGILGISSYLFYSNFSDDKQNGENTFGVLISTVTTFGSMYFLYKGIETETTILTFE